MPASRRAVLLARLVALALSLAAALALAELAVRLLAPQPVMLVDRGLYLSDPPRRYRLQPGFRGEITNRVEFTTAVEIDGAGLRGPEVGAEASGARRVLVLGDSFAFGVGARQEETYPTRLAIRLAAAGTPAEVLNAGVPGFGVPDEAAWFAAWGAPLAPDLVVLTIFVGNDLQDATPGLPRAMAVDGVLVIEGESPGSLSRWLYYHSQLYVLIKTSPAGDAVRRALGRRTPRDRAEVAAEMTLYSDGPPSPIERDGGAMTAAAIGDLVAHPGAGRVAAVLVPSLLQVDPVEWRKTLAARRLDPRAHDAARPTKLLVDLCARHDVPVLDLSAPFAAAIARGERIYYPIDRHLTPAGYDLTAAEVARFLSERFPTVLSAPTP